MFILNEQYNIAEIWEISKFKNEYLGFSVFQ
jgi:hypothetical protein